MVLNGTVVTQRSYSTRLGVSWYTRGTKVTLLIYYVLNIYLNVLKLDDGSGYFGGAIQQSKRHQIQRTIHVKAVLLVRFDRDLYLRCIITNMITCIFLIRIERKTMQRSYGLNVILSGSKRHKHGGEGLVFVPVKRPYVPGTSSKLYEHCNFSLSWSCVVCLIWHEKKSYSRIVSLRLKWKSHVTAQFQVKVTHSKERKPLYCIHTKQGSGSKFYDYVTPEPGLAAEYVPYSFPHIPLIFKRHVWC